MKKLFTLFASAALLAGAANAEVKTAEIEMNFRNWSTGENMAEPQTTTISYEDGVYTINEFMNSTRIIQFKLTADEYTTDGEKNYCVEIPSEFFDGDFLLPGGNYYKTYLYGYNGSAADEKTTVNYIQGYPTSSYIKAWSPEEYDTPIYFCFCMRVMCGSETSDWMYFDFYMPDLAGILEGSSEQPETGASQNITIEFTDYDFNEIASPQTTKVSYNEGVFSVANIFNTGLAFNFALPLDKSAYYNEEGAFDWVEATILPENLIEYEGDSSLYLYDYETESYAVGLFYGYNGSEEATEFKYIYTFPGELWAYAFNNGDGTVGIAVDLYFGATVDYNWAEAYADFVMRDLAGIFNETAVETVETSNAPAEYYNLQGVRVINPEKGLYIMRQGNKAVKVMK